MIYSELISGALCYVLAAAVTALLIWYALNGGLEKEKIALKDVESVFAGPESFWFHLIGGGYGIVEIKAVGKKYKVHFVDEANTVPDIVMNHINNLKVL